MRTITMIRNYQDLMRFKTFEDRYNYLKLGGTVGDRTFGFDRYLNQLLYTSDRWRKLRNHIIVRDNGCDLAIEDREINDMVVIHHINPITIEDIELLRDVVFAPEYLICTSKNTHLAIHYGDESLLTKLPEPRRPNDTCPWK